ncbi:MAG: hypothetical protein ACE5IP_06695 [Terriglobia bacterium]
MFAGGALVTAVLAALIRSGLTAVLEPWGRRLDRWRRVWFHPERELALLFESLLIVALLATFAARYNLPVWAGAVVVTLWALHLPADLWSWARRHRTGNGTRELHLRGFWLLEVGPLWVRMIVLLLGVVLYWFLPPVRAGLDTLMSFLLTSLEGWLL